MQESKSSQVEVFLNSVPILTSLSREEKLKLANALEEHTFEPQEHIIEEVCCPLQVRKHVKNVQAQAEQESSL